MAGGTSGVEALAEGAAGEAAAGPGCALHGTASGAWVDKQQQAMPMRFIEFSRENGCQPVPLFPFALSDGDHHFVGPIIRTAPFSTQFEFSLPPIHFSDSCFLNSLLLISPA
jgi:hypothetical protein